ncbi:MAG: D-alanyl-D-alanine carboxypeptidase family protein [Eubacteriales bacterium]
MPKRVLTLLLAVLSAISILSGTAAADSSEDSDALAASLAAELQENDALQDYEDKVYPASSYAVEALQVDLGVNAKSAILMESETGRVLYELNADEKLPPASVTKVMTMLLSMEALDNGKIKLDEMVSCSDKAASMGGSQVYLEPNEQMSVNDMLKAIAVASGNDASLAMAEHISGSEEAFVAEMNAKAASLGMKNTTFINTTGLDADGHLTTARDIALMSRELLKHPKILEYTGIWMDSLRGGAFGLANTNKLIRFYPGATGLKTGSTDSAKYCISATAQRGGMHLIAVIMGSPSSDYRFASAKRLLDYGFSNYALFKPQAQPIEPVKVTAGVVPQVNVSYTPAPVLVSKGKESKIETVVDVSPQLAAPVEKGQRVGQVRYLLDGQELAKCDITASEGVERISVWGIFTKLLSMFL